MASWVDTRMMAVVLLVAGACGHPYSPPGENSQEIHEKNRTREETNTERRAREGDRDGMALPDGVVLNVKTTDIGTFVAISVGSKDGVMVGDEYHLSRGKYYVGKIDIIRVSEDGAIGRFDEKYNGGGPPKADDKAWVD